MKRENITFDNEDLLFLKALKLKGKITTRAASTIEVIFQKIDPNYTLCKSCMPSISGETNRLISMAEGFIGMDLKVYDSEVGSSYTEESLKSMKAVDILKLVKESTGLDIDLPKNKKKEIVEQAFKMLNK